MKSNQERSNGCLPPKKREMLALEQRPVVVAAAPAAALVADSPHTENLAWLASVASERCRFRDTESPRCPVSSSSSFSSASFSSSSFSSSSSSSPATPLSTVPLASLPAVYPTALPQQSGTIQYAQLGPNVQFISSGPYAGYISSHIIPANHHHHSAHNSSGATGQRHPQLDGYTTALISPGHKGEHQFQIGLSPADLAAVSLSNSAQVTGQYIHLDGSAALTDSHLQLHAHPTVLPHTLTLGPSQLVVQYTDSSAGKKVDGHSKGFLNGELEVVKHTKVCQPVNHHQQVQSYEARHILLPAEYTQNPSGLQTSLVLVAQPNSGADSDHHNKVSLLQTEKGGICLGKPVSRASSFSSLSSTEALKSSTQHTVIQTTLSHEELPANLYSSTQPPIIGYIASAGHPHAVSYHATLPQHLVIPSGQSLLIPVSATTSATAIPHISTAMPHAYLATALSKCEVLGSEGHQPHPAVSQAPVLSILPPHPAPAVVAPPYPATAPTPAAAAPAPAPHAQISIQASPSPSSSASPATLPPFFMRGSIIQLADGELKRVEDLKTEDFIQSAEISSELKIDSSTVERIDGGQTPNAVVIQFAVGELKAQVCVEVLLEYPFFVFGQGWSSCCPDRTTQLFELSCAKLCVGDVCVSLTLRGLRNGSVTSSQALETKLRTSHNSSSSSSSCPPHGTEPAVRNSTGPHAAGSNSGLLMKAAAGSDRLERGQATGPGPGEAAVYGGARAASDTPPPASAGGLAGRGPVKADMPPPPSSTQTGDPDRPAGRKRRWSAPERDQTERAEEEPPLTLPKPSFIVQEVKLSMEGRASTGK